MWTTNPPTVGRLREHDIIRNPIQGLTATVSANSTFDSYQRMTRDMIHNVVLQKNREIRSRNRDWNAQHSSDLRPDLSNVTDDDNLMAFLGLCIFTDHARATMNHF